MKLSGAQLLIQSLHKENVEYIFGYPGGAVLHIYDALFQQREIKHILARHEQGATHAADGYARATGRPGVVLVTSGPGATNSITGIATAYMDSVPMVVLTGQVPSYLVGSDAFQEVDTLGISRPIVKHNFLIKSAAEIPEIIKKSFYIATSGRPGPVLIDIPKDATDPSVTFDFDYPIKLQMRSYNPKINADPTKINKAAELLLAAKRPVIYSGGGVVQGKASTALRNFVDEFNFPITNTLMGLGAYPGTHKNFLGMLGMHGTLEANWAMHECDVLLAVGARFDDRITGEVSQFCPDAKIIHIDSDPSSIDKIINIDIGLVGQCKNVLEALLKACKTSASPRSNFDAWWDKINEWRSQKCLEYQKSDKVIKPQYVIEQLYRLTKGDSYITSDVGQHQMWAAQYYAFNEPNRWINSGGLGTMGFGLPAAFGVKLAYPDETVCCITGEASIMMCIQELSTCLQYQTPIKIINLNNRYMGMVRQWQEFFYDSRYSQSYVEALPNFVDLAKSYGHHGVLVEKPVDVIPAISEALEQKDRLVFLDFITDPAENVFPMIEAGKGHDKMLMGDRECKMT